jgi:hypothetical protein
MNREIKRYALTVATLVLAHGICATSSHSQDAEKPRGLPPKNEAHVTSEFGALLGRWVRPDGGYVINILAADSGGKLNAGYANPSPLPFAAAQASRNDGVLNVFFELRAGGYNGSTYTLTYDPSKDILRGVYYQAVARQTFDVYFVRGK